MGITLSKFYFRKLLFQTRTKMLNLAKKISRLIAIYAFIFISKHVHNIQDYPVPLPRPGLGRGTSLSYRVRLVIPDLIRYLWSVFRVTTFDFRMTTFDFRMTSFEFNED